MEMGVASEGVVTLATITGVIMVTVSERSERSKF